MSTLLCRFSSVLFLLILWIENIGGKEVRIVCYYTNWSVYRPGDAKFNPQNINPYLCTHLIYAFGGFTKENTLKPFDKYQDVEKGGYAKFVGLKTYNKNLKTLLAIGGWNEGSTRFSPMVANADRRKELVKNTIKFLRQNHFDGLDLDWEYPSFRDGGKTRDRDNYAQLVQELREEFERESEKTGRPRLLLTMAVPAGIEYIKKGYDIPKLTKYLDWMNILSYDYHSAYEPAVNHHSPLYPIEEENEYSYDIDLNIDYTIKHYVESGADKSKLVLGIPTYGRSYTLYNPDANEIGAPADGPGEMGDATRENGYLAYYEICENIKSNDWQVELPLPGIMGPYSYKDNQWVSYDDAEIARVKAEYVAENGLGGIMFWSIDNDDFRGKCGDKPYPIIEAAKEALLKAYGLTDSNLLATTKKPIKSRTRSRTRGTTKVTSTTEATVVVNSGGRQSARRKPHRINSSKSETKSTSRRRRPSTKKSTQTEETTPTTIGSSLLVTPSYTTPPPPSTPDSGGDFKCEDEGFFPHPKDCKKYFWCLSGPSELGIIAHQFTCPAGLHFNKAAASCDYTQNVLCNKKIQKSSTTTTTTTTLAPTSTTTVASKASSLFVNRRPPPKITAATSRTTTTTTPEPEYDEDYEYYDDEDVKEENTAKEPEEDPRVIKELIELIRKAGGLEELEKQLKLQEDGNTTVTSSDFTTETSISKSLYQRVLGKARENINKPKTNIRYSSVNRNSRGPQNEGISQQEKQDSSKSSNSRPQYTSILRSRSSTVPSVDEEDAEDDVKKTNEDDAAHDNTEDNLTSNRDRTAYKKFVPEYVTIRRQRLSTTTAETRRDDTEGRNLSSSPFKQLGEEEEEDDLIEDTEENDKIVRNTLKSSTTPTPYVTIRRTKPTTTSTEETTNDSENEFKTPERVSTETDKISSSTSGPAYATIRRQKPSIEPDITTSRYVEIRTRGTTTVGTTTISEASDTELPETTLRFRSTTPTATTSAGAEAKELTTTPSSGEKIDTSSGFTNKTDTQVETSNLVDENTVENANNGITESSKLEESNNVKHIVIEKDDITTVPSESLNTDETIENKTPQLFEPRPFTSSLRRGSTTTSTIATPTTQQTSKIPPRPFRIRPHFYRNVTTASISTTTKSTPITFASSRSSIRRKYGPTTSRIVENQDSSADTSSKIFTSTESIRKHYFRNKLATRQPIVHISTAKVNRFSPYESEQTDLSSASITQQSTEGSFTGDINDDLVGLREIQEALTRHKNLPSTTAVPRTTRIIYTKFISSSTASTSKVTTPFPLTTQRIIIPKPRPQAFDKIPGGNLYRKQSVKDYYDNDFVGLLGNLPEHSKVVLHSGGVIQCLDQGNFPHPVSCKKFISCAKMETGQVIGWEYTCPKNLSFDPVGGICNWSADLGCDG